MSIIFSIIMGLIIFSLYIIIGLRITEKYSTTLLVIFVWFIYTFLWITFINMVTLAYFWDVIRKKTGPTGVRGPPGDKGEIGIVGKCPNNAIESYFIKSITDLIDGLYKEKQTGEDSGKKSIIDPATNKFYNRYLNDKINKMATSRQYKTINDNLSNYNKPLDNLIKYVKGIWTEWFNLIYDASNNGDWFMDENADETFDWKDNNDPFEEIRKYDIYYWGMIRSFRPLKAEVCRNIKKKGNQNAALPLQIDKPRLKIIESNDYHWVVDDNNAHGYPDAGFYRPMKVKLGEDTYYPVGDIIMAGDENWVYPYKNPMKFGPTIVGPFEYNYKITQNYGTNGPDMRTILVAGDVKEPIGYEDMSDDQGGDSGLIARRLICPEGYTSLGDIYFGYKRNEFPNNKPVCVPKDCVEPAKNPGKIVWQNRFGDPVLALNQFDSGNRNADPDNGYNLMRNYKNGKEFLPIYKIKDKCLTIQAQPNIMAPTDTFSKEELGLGWYGTPFKSDPKYSIFTFLGIIPEGVIGNISTGRRLYIIHYGGEDINKFIIIDKSLDKDSNDFDSALEVSIVKTDALVNVVKFINKNDIRDFSKTEDRRLWEIVVSKDPRFIFMRNFYNGKYLYVGLHQFSGDQIYSTVKLNDPNTSKPSAPYNKISEDTFRDSIKFSFDSAYGVQLDQLEKEKVSRENKI